MSPPWIVDPEGDKKRNVKNRQPKNKRKRQRQVGAGLGDDDDEDPFFGTQAVEVPSDDEHDDKKAHLQKTIRKRVRPGSCWCNHEGGCRDLDGCCFDNDPTAIICPCRQRLKEAEKVETPELGACLVCMEDGKRRDCCDRLYCKYCYTSTGNCPGCQVITTGDNAGKFWSDLEKRGAGEVRDGEECRICLRQGFRRKCCGEFFCADDYFKTGYCPSCQVPVQRRVRYTRTPRDPGTLPVVTGYLMSLLITLVVLAIAATLAVNDATLPRTIFDRRCYGFFPSCSSDERCVEYPGSLQGGVPGAITEWEECSETSVNKMYGSYCVYDEAMFIHSKEKWGFDFCEDSFLGGIHTFEDGFESWANASVSSPTLASARWASVYNGKPSDLCGSHSGDSALTFSGVDMRRVVTQDVDVRFGGKLSFRLKMGPYTTDPTLQECKPAYGGNIWTYYSTDAGDTWEELEKLETFLYRGETFTLVEVELPPAANTTATRFMLDQLDFENANEYWAIDDFTVVSYFQDGWDKSVKFESLVDSEQDTLQEIQCCLNSEQCNYSKKRQERIDCSQYEIEASNERALGGAELYVVIAGFLTLLRGAYRMGEGVVTDGWASLIPDTFRKPRAKIFLADDPMSGAMDSKFSLRVSQLWRLRFLVLVGVPYAVAWLWCASLLRNFFLKEDIELASDFNRSFTFHFYCHISGLFLLACYIDLSNIYLLARDVVCILPAWVPSLDIDLRPSAQWLQLGPRTIPLSAIKDSESFTKRFCVLLASGYILGAMPWCFIALIVKYQYLPFFISRYTTAAFGGIVVMRAWLGVDFVPKVGYVLLWFFTLDLYKRDEIGNVVFSKKTRLMVAYSTAVGTSFALLGTMLVSTSALGYACLAGLCGSSFYGLMLAIFQGLPVTPCFKLTTLSKGVYIRITRDVECPCENANFNHCGLMHSRDEVLCVFPRDPLTFQQMLAGDDSLG